MKIKQWWRKHYRPYPKGPVKPAWFFKNTPWAGGGAMGMGFSAFVLDDNMLARFLSAILIGITASWLGMQQYKWGWSIGRLAGYGRAYADNLEIRKRIKDGDISTPEEHRAAMMVAIHVFDEEDSDV